MSFFVPLVAGGIAGVSVDMVFFPIDTIKTRLQAERGFFANGGWRGMYKGIGSTMVASAPGAALFFLSYEKSKQNLPLSSNLNHMVSGIIGESTACLVRVPSELIKQRVQTGQFPSTISAFKSIIRQPQVFKNLYRGYGITLFREIPFTAIQFPLYEKLKQLSGNKPVNSIFCGCIAGGVAAAATTPLDVIKTRMMTHQGDLRTWQMAQTVIKQGHLFKGIVPRTMWISAGGAVFLGMYEMSKSMLTV